MYYHHYNKQTEKNCCYDESVSCKNQLRCNEVSKQRIQNYIILSTFPIVGELTWDHTELVSTEEKFQLCRLDEKENRKIKRLRDSCSPMNKRGKNFCFTFKMPKKLHEENAVNLSWCYSSGPVIASVHLDTTRMKINLIGAIFKEQDDRNINSMQTHFLVTFFRCTTTIT